MCFRYSAVVNGNGPSLFSIERSLARVIAYSKQYAGQVKRGLWPSAVDIKFSGTVTLRGMRLALCKLRAMLAPGKAKAPDLAAQGSWLGTNLAKPLAGFFRCRGRCAASPARRDGTAWRAVRA